MSPSDCGGEQLERAKARVRATPPKRVAPLRLAELETVVAAMRDRAEDHGLVARIAEGKPALPTPSRQIGERPLFRVLTRGGDVLDRAPDPTAVRQLIRSAATRAGLNPQ